MGPGVLSEPLFLCIGRSAYNLDPVQEVACIARGN